MRIKIVFIFSLLIIALQILSTKVFAACDPTECWGCTGRCGMETCKYSGTFTTTSSYFECVGGCLTIRCWDPSQTVDSNTTYWNPQGGSYDDVNCLDFCDSGCSEPTNGSCIYETGEQLCDCEPLPGDPTPTSDPGGGSDPTPTPTPANSFITGSIQEDNGAALSGNVCTQATDNPIPINNLSITSGLYTGHFSTINQNFYTITRPAGSNYTVTLDLSNQTGLIEYICSCPAALDPDNPYICQYTGVAAPSENINFYLQVNNLSSDSWFQIFGGNVFGRGGISSVVPYSFCDGDSNCRSSLNAPLPFSANLFSSGFPIANTGNSGAIRSYDYSSAYHSYFHLPTRASNLNSYDVDTDLSQLSYDYFYKLAENSVQEVGNGEDLEPRLEDWIYSSWWLTDEVNYIKVNGNVNIDETQGFQILDGTKLVVFVDGNLILDDSEINDTYRKITSVAQGGFLAFFVSGDVIVTADVGYELDPLNPSTPTVSNANSNLEGVFVANNNLIIQSKTAIGEVPPDRKFIGSGTFVGWNDILLNRTFNDNNFGPILSNSQAVENFIYRPDLLANWPVKLKASTSNWREVDPQFINQ